MLKRTLLGAVSLMALLPHIAWACACGCGVFDVGTGAMLPTDSGGTVWLEYDFMNQSQNWHQASTSPKIDNDDKQIRTSFITAGGEYMFSRSWGAMLTVPYVNRYFETADSDSGAINHFEHSSLGDAQIRGIYSGLSDDMSTGLTFGLKLPTGNFSAAGFDRDTEIGSGSTNLLLGAYHVGSFGDESGLSWFVNGQWNTAFAWQSGYRPGNEVDIATGVYYDAGPVWGAGKISPLLQLIGANRLRDGGINSDPADSGYTRLLVSPGVEYNVNSIKLYGDVEMPIAQNVNGNQLVAPVLFKFIVGYNF